MNQRTRFAYLLVVLVFVTACAHTPSIESVPTRTPKPTFTTMSDTSTPVATRPGPSATDTVYPSVAAISTSTTQPTATIRPTNTAYPTTAARPTDTARPTATSVPTATPMPTATPIPAATPSPTALSCSAGYDLHTNAQLGFSACYPTGWVVSQHEDQEHAMRGVSFVPPTMDADTGVGFKIITVSISPGITGSNEEEILKAIALQLIRKYEKVLLGWPYDVLVDGRKAVEANYEITTLSGSEVMKVTGWEATFVASGRQWTISVAGRSEYRAELEDIHNQFLSHFHLLPL